MRFEINTMRNYCTLLSQDVSFEDSRTLTIPACQNRHNTRLFAIVQKITKRLIRLTLSGIVLLQQI